MAVRTGWLVGLALAAALAGCGKKTERADGAAGPAEAGAQGIAVGEPNPATPDSGPGSGRMNDGPPVDGPVTMTAPATAVGGAMIDVTWTSPANQGDYIDIVPSGYAATTGEITYVYIRESGATSSLRAPTTPGEYDVRYVLDLESERIVKAVSPLVVTAATATVQAPAEALGGATLEIAWTGPNGKGDYIDIVPAGSTATSGEIDYAYTSDGSPAKFRAPGPSGEYDVRYLLEGPSGRKIVAVSRIKVTTPAADLRAPDRAAKGAKVSVEWTGPNHGGDYVDLVREGHAPTSGELSYFYTRVGATGQLTAPTDAGVYEIRYVMEAPGRRMVLAKRSLTVQ